MPIWRDGGFGMEPAVKGSSEVEEREKRYRRVTFFPCCPDARCDGRHDNRARCAYRAECSDRRYRGLGVPDYGWHRLAPYRSKSPPARCQGHPGSCQNQVIAARLTRASVSSVFPFVFREGFWIRIRGGRAHLGPELIPRLSSLRHRAFVLDRADVARVPIQDDGPEHPSHNLPAPGLRELMDEVHLPHDGHGPEFSAHRLEQLLPQLGGGLESLLEGHEGRDHLASNGIGPPGHAGLRDRGMLEERGLDLDRPDPVGGDLDDFVRAAREPDVA